MDAVGTESTSFQTKNTPESQRLEPKMYTPQKINTEPENTAPPWNFGTSSSKPSWIMTSRFQPFIFRGCFLDVSPRLSVWNRWSSSGSRFAGRSLGNPWKVYCFGPSNRRGPGQRFKRVNGVPRAPWAVFNGSFSEDTSNCWNLMDLKHLEGWLPFLQL